MCRRRIECGGERGPGASCGGLALLDRSLDRLGERPAQRQRDGVAERLDLSFDVKTGEVKFRREALQSLGLLEVGGVAQPLVQISPLLAKLARSGAAARAAGRQHPRRPFWIVERGATWRNVEARPAAV